MSKDATEDLFRAVNYLGTTAEQIQTLIERGADINAKDTNGKTVLMYAINHPNLELARILIRAGADASDKDTALTFASRDIQEFLSIMQKKE